jgi:hypothetical protein
MFRIGTETCKNGAPAVVETTVTTTVIETTPVVEEVELIADCEDREWRDLDEGDKEGITLKIGAEV